jgi:hypothetical protein
MEQFAIPEDFKVFSTRIVHGHEKSLLPIESRR